MHLIICIFAYSHVSINFYVHANKYIAIYIVVFLGGLGTIILRKSCRLWISYILLYSVNSDARRGHVTSRMQL